MRQRTYFVAGATGKQGGALARQLLARGHRIHALTRKPGGLAARDLERLGAEIHRGGLEDVGPMMRAMSGCDAAFAVTSFRDAGVDAELRQGRCILDAARAAKVPHLVLGSMAGADRSTGVPHMESKGQLERALARAGVPYTILAPVFLMENWLPILPQALARGRLAYPLPAHRTLQMVAVEDVAAFACRVLENPTTFETCRVEIAGETLTMAQIATTLGEAVWRHLPYHEVPLAAVWAKSEQLGRLCAWLDWQGTHVDVDRLRARYRDIGWTSFASWTRAQDWGTAHAPAPAFAPPVTTATWIEAAR